MGNFEDIKEEALYRALTVIRQLPGVWLGKNSLKLLDAYINGFIAGKSDMKTPFYCPEWFDEFKKYVADVCVKGNECYGIVDSIYKDGYDDENGIYRFYQLLDDFCVEKYPKEESDMQYESEKSALKEIRAAEIGYEEICRLAQQYISDNFNKIFDFEIEEGGIITRKHLYLWDTDREHLKIIDYDTNYYKSDTEAKNAIKDIEISAKTLLCDKPYTVIRAAGDEGERSIILIKNVQAGT